MQTLESDHAELATILDQIKVELAKPELSRSLQILDLFWARLAVHIRAENLCLFPAVLNAPESAFGVNDVPEFEHVKAIIDNLRADHNFFMTELANAVNELRDVTVHPESYSIPAVIGNLTKRIEILEKRLSQHNDIEESEIYRWPSLLLDDESLKQLRLGVVSQIENLPPRLEREGPKSTQ